MPEKIISPYVFIKESDQSFYSSGIAQVGAVIIGTTETGPAFVPTLVSSINEFESIFGNDVDYSYVSYAARSYLKNANQLYIVRVLGEEGWNSTFNRTLGQNDFVKIIVGGKTAAVLALTATTGNKMNVSAINVSGSASSFVISSGSLSVSCSFNPSSPFYIKKVFGNNPTARFSQNELSREFYIYQLFESHSLSNLNAIVTRTTGSLDFILNKSYSSAETPWIQSQLVDNLPINLFKFATFDHGNNANKKIKIVIENIKKPTDENSYGSFDVIVRDYNDTDLKPIILESFISCNLDSNSPNYILKMIGDKYVKLENNKLIEYGNFKNKSKYIRVIASSNLESIPKFVVPFGHAAYLNPVPGNDFPDILTMNTQGPSDIYDSRYCWGIDTSNNVSDLLTMPIADNTSPNNTSAFNLDTKNGHLLSNYTGSLSNINAPTEMLKFFVLFQSGWDGIPPNRIKNFGESITATNVFGFDCSTVNSEGTKAFIKAINTISNPDEYDINMITIPGILGDLHPFIINHAINVCEERGDVILIFDLTGPNTSVNSTITKTEAYDTNYAATYFPWVKILNTKTNKNVLIPPSVVIPGVFSFNDKIAAPWYAPAGLNRGGLTEVVDVKFKLNKTERDALYNARINPIATFPGQGLSVWGQKTLQKKASALDRVNVRRLLIEIKKFFASTSKFIIFEPNTDQTRQQFLQIVNPYMDSIKNRLGIYNYKIVMDETNNTPDVIDRNVLVGTIFIQPTKAAEFIELTFNILPTGASFS